MTGRVAEQLGDYPLLPLAAEGGRRLDEGSPRAKSTLGALSEAVWQAERRELAPRTPHPRFAPLLPQAEEGGHLESGSPDYKLPNLLERS